MIAPEYDNLNKPQLYLFDLFRQNGNTGVRLNIIKKWFKIQSISKLFKIYPLDNIPGRNHSSFLRTSEKQ